MHHRKHAERAGNSMIDQSNNSRESQVEFHWKQSKMKPATEKRLMIGTIILLMLAIVLAHTKYLAIIRYHPAYFYLYVLIIVLVIHLWFGKWFSIDVTPENIRVRMPKSNSLSDIEKSRFNKTPPIKLTWEEIREVEIRKLHIIFTIRSGDTRQFAMMYLFYRQIRRLKSTLITLAQMKKVPVQIVE